MKTKTVSQTWTCTRCAAENEIYNEISFKTFCLDLLAGKTGLVICSCCGQTDQIRFKAASLELVTG